QKGKDLLVYVWLQGMKQVSREKRGRDGDRLLTYLSHHGEVLRLDDLPEALLLRGRRQNGLMPVLTCFRQNRHEDREQPRLLPVRPGSDLIRSDQFVYLVQERRHVARSR